MFARTTAPRFRTVLVQVNCVLRKWYRQGTAKTSLVCLRSPVSVRKAEAFLQTTLAEQVLSVVVPTYCLLDYHFTLCLAPVGPHKIDGKGTYDCDHQNVRAICKVSAVYIGAAMI